MKPQKSSPPRAKQNWANNFHPKFDWKTAIKVYENAYNVHPKNTFKHNVLFGEGETREEVFQIKACEAEKNGFVDFSRGVIFI